MARSDGVFNQVHCNVCMTIEGKDKLLATKLDALQKHVGRKKASKSPCNGRGYNLLL
jgi:hypothetical protein